MNEQKAQKNQKIKNMKGSVPHVHMLAWISENFN